MNSDVTESDREPVRFRALKKGAVEALRKAATSQDVESMRSATDKAATRLEEMGRTAVAMGAEPKSAGKVTALMKDLGDLRGRLSLRVEHDEEAALADEMSHLASRIERLAMTWRTR